MFPGYYIVEVVLNRNPFSPVKNYILNILLNYPETHLELNIFFDPE